MRKNQTLINAINRAADAVLIFLSYFLAAYLRFDVLWVHEVNMQLLGGAKFLAAVGLYSVGLVGVYTALRMYGTRRFARVSREVCTILAVNACGLIGLMALLYLFKQDFTRLTLFFFWGISSLLVILRRMVTRMIQRKMLSKGYDKHTVLLIGSGKLAQRYFETVASDVSCDLKGYLAEQENPAMGPRLGGIEKLTELLQNRDIDEVVIALRQGDPEQIGGMIAACGRYSAKASVIPAYNDFIPSLPQVEQMGTLKLMNVRSTPDKGILWSFVKRLMDICGSFIGLCLTSPIMLAVAIAVKKCDGGPAIFSQTRVGKNGREFKMYKFRSMYIDAEERLAELQKFNEVDGPAFKMENDPRITKVGHFIRKTSLDELPQLWNILKGEMSIVGPRPPLPREVAQYSDWDWGRLAVKPGLTCYWQVSGRSDVSFDDWMKLDLKYVEEQGFWTDVKILFKTVGVVLTGKGAY